MLDGEKNIIQEAIEGESSAFGLLYDHYEPQIYRFIYLKVGHREEAEDLTHQVFIQSFTKIRDYEDKSFPFSSWLYRIARNEVIDYYRVRKVHISIHDENIENIPEAKKESLDDQLALEQVKNAVKLLKPTEQDVLILRFVEDMAPNEIAAAMGKTPLAVRLIQHRAIKNLKKLVAPADGAKNSRELLWSSKNS